MSVANYRGYLCFLSRPPRSGNQPNNNVAHLTNPDLHSTTIFTHYKRDPINGLCDRTTVIASYHHPSIMARDNEANSPPPQTPLSAVERMDDARTRNRSSTASSGRVRSASLRFLESSPPVGMWQATGNALAQAPTPAEIRSGSFSHDGWDREMQRRNSTVSEESSRRLSRTNSAQTPGSLKRQQTNTNPLLPLSEPADDGSPVSPTIPRGTVSGPATSTQATKPPLKPVAIDDDDDDPFSKFVGRGKIDGQSYVRKPKTIGSGKIAQPRTSADPYAIPKDDENFDPLDERDNTRRISKKFQDLTGEPVSVIEGQGEKLTTVTTGTARPSSSSSASKELGPNADGVYPNGYKFPPKHTWGEATKIGLKAFWKFTITPLGFLIVLYGLNVVAWGGMLFLLLIGGGQEFMCYPPGSHGEKDCNNIDSPRRIWIEIDSQILNSLFCVTGFGLIPWRFRDFYYLMNFRIRHDQSALRRLAGIHRAWFRLAGSADLPTDPDAPVNDPENNPAIPLPPSKIPDAPLTGVRAPATRMWKLDYVIWAFVLNTFLQAVLSGFMWGFNRYKRPSWSTGTFVALACIVAGLGGLMSFQEGKRVKKFEGIPVKEGEMLVDVERDVVGGEKKNDKRKSMKKDKVIVKEKGPASKIGAQ